MGTALLRNEDRKRKVHASIDDVELKKYLLEKNKKVADIRSEAMSPEPVSSPMFFHDDKQHD